MTCVSFFIAILYMYIIVMRMRMLIKIARSIVVQFTA